MKKLMILSLILIAALGDEEKTGDLAFEWKSSSLFPNGTVVQACVGDNVTLPWDFDMTSLNEISIEWSKTSNDQEKRLDLARSNGNTFYGLVPERSLKFLPNAGIMLPGVTLADTGYYKVEVILPEDSESYEQVAFLRVSDAPVKLHAFIFPENVYNSTTGLWHVQLGCRHPDTQGQSALPLIWTTPSNRRVSSTSYNNNTFILELPLPMEEGDYSCSMNSSVPEDKCLSTSRAATVNVKGVIKATAQNNNDNTAALVERKFDNITALVQSKFDGIKEKSNNDNIAALVERKFDNITALVQSKFDGIKAMVQSNNDNTTALVQSKFDNITALVQSKFDNVNSIVLQLHFGLLQLLGSDYVYRPASCVDVQKYDNVSGIHTLIVNNRSVKVYCDQATDNGGWMVIQRRQDGSVNFYRNWQQYEFGFGDLNKEFWIGLANLYHLTKNKNYKLRVELTVFSGKYVDIVAVYNTFSISGAKDYYRLNVGGYTGNAGDFLAFHNKMQFSTWDKDRDTLTGNCAQVNQGAWWYKNCVYFNLNGRYETSGGGGIISKKLNGEKILFKRIEMKIKQ